MEMCEYGCNREAKYTLKNGKKCCSKTYNQCPKIREKNSNGVKKAHKENRMYKLTKEDRLKSNEKAIREAINKAFTKNSHYSNEFIKKYMLSHFNYEYKCSICGIFEWNNKKIKFRIRPYRWR